MLNYTLDTFYILISGALVMWMAAGFSMLEAGLVRSRNTVEILTKNISLYAIACVLYFMVGYAIMYPEKGKWLLLSWFVSGDESIAPAADFFYQSVFVATAMSVVSGAVAERMKLWIFLAFCVVMTGFIYPMAGFWVWGGGSVFGLFNLGDFGFVDFAGSGVVHLSGAMAALAGASLLGPRSDKYGADGKVKAIAGANLPIACLGALILWFGWFGFNGGSQLAISTAEDARAVGLVFTNTNLAACAGLLSALIFTKVRDGKTDLPMGLNGALAALVAITADPASPAPWLAVVLGAVGGLLVVASVPLFDYFRIDDPVGALSVHGVAGLFGLMAVPLSNEGARFAVQALGALTLVTWVGGTSWVVWLLLGRFFGLRVSSTEERKGCDAELCGMQAYPEFVD